MGNLYLVHIASCRLQPAHKVSPVGIHAALHTILLLECRGWQLVDVVPALELLARQHVHASATVASIAPKAIRTEPLLSCITLHFGRFEVVFVLGIPA